MLKFIPFIAIIIALVIAILTNVNGCKANINQGTIVTNNLQDIRGQNATISYKITILNDSIVYYDNLYLPLSNDKIGKLARQIADIYKRIKDTTLVGNQLSAEFDVLNDSMDQLKNLMHSRKTEIVASNAFKDSAALEASSNCLAAVRNSLKERDQLKKVYGERRSECP